MSGNRPARKPRTGVGRLITGSVIAWFGLNAWLTQPGRSYLDTDPNPAGLWAVGVGGGLFLWGLIRILTRP